MPRDAIKYSILSVLFIKTNILFDLINYISSLEKI